MKSSPSQYPDGGGALGGAIVGLYQNGGCDEPLKVCNGIRSCSNAQNKCNFGIYNRYKLLSTIMKMNAKPIVGLRIFIFYEFFLVR